MTEIRIYPFSNHFNVMNLRFAFMDSALTLESIKEVIKNGDNEDQSKYTSIVVSESLSNAQKDAIKSYFSNVYIKFV